MTDLFGDQANGQLSRTEAIQQELKQFKKLQHLSNHDVAFRMATNLNTVRYLRKSHNQITRPLYDTGIDYAIRVILGERKIKTTGKLLALSDRDILAIPRIGHARLAHIRLRLQEFFA